MHFAQLFHSSASHPSLGRPRYLQEIEPCLWSAVRVVGCDCTCARAVCSDHLIQAVIVLDVALWLVDGFPNWMILSGLGAHICLSALLSTFPFISITAPPFIGGCREPQALHSPRSGNFHL